MSPPQLSTITIRCKVPPGHIAGAEDEFNLGEFSISAKIGDVRQRIQLQVPGNPSPPQQRILYGGRALVDNEQSLADALNVKREPSQDTYVVHLLIRGEHANASVPAQRGASVPIAGSTQSDPIQPQSTSPMAAQLRNANPFPHHTPTPAQQPAHNHQPALHQQLHAQLLQNHQQQHHHQHHHIHHQPNPFVPPGFPFAMPPINAGGPVPMQQHIQTAVRFPVAGQNPAVTQEQQEQRMGGGHTQAHGVGQQPIERRSEAAQQAQIHPQGGTQVSLGADSPGPHAAGRNAQPPSAGTQGQANTMNVPQRPISNQGFHIEGLGPNGQRFAVHQQTLSFPVPTFPFGLPMVPVLQNPLTNNSPSMALNATQNAASAAAYARARESLVDIQRMLDELDSTQHAAENQRSQIEQLRERARALNDYIEQTHVQNTTHLRNVNGIGSSATGPLQATAANSTTPGAPSHGALPAANGDASYTTCYLLSSPQGPSALLYSPQHGRYHNSSIRRPEQPHGGIAAAFPHPLSALAEAPRQGGPGAQDQGQPHHNGPGADPQAPAVRGQLIRINGQVPQVDPMRPVQAILGHFWLLFRIMLFSYFLLGSNMGWRRPLVLIAIGTLFWMVRMGLLGDGGVLRRWWEDITRGPRQPGQQDANAAAVQAPAERDGRPGVAQGRRRMPTPEEVAQRLLNQQEQANVAMNPQVQWIRERIRPAERAAALFVGSLWPGVGEAAVRAREEEARRRAEEEVAARRRQEEERERREAEEKKDEDAGESGEAKDEAKDEAKGGASDETVAADAETAQEKVEVEGDRSSVSAS